MPRVSQRQTVWPQAGELANKQSEASATQEQGTGHLLSDTKNFERVQAQILPHLKGRDLGLHILASVLSSLITMDSQ